MDFADALEDELSKKLDNFFDGQAKLVCRWLAGRSEISFGDMGTKGHPNLGLVAFNRRHGPTSALTTFVHPVAARIPEDREVLCSDVDRLHDLTRMRRDASKVKHFEKELVEGENWGSFLDLGLVSELEKNCNLKEIWKSKNELSDSDRNHLDLLYFKPEHRIMSFPIPVLGCPLVTCYIPVAGEIPDDECVDGSLDSALKRPLSPFVAMSLLGSLSYLGKLISQVANPEWGTAFWEDLFLKLASQLFFAKNATLTRDGAQQQWFEAETMDARPPIYEFSDGVKLSLELPGKVGEGFKWSCCLPSFRISGKRLSSEASDVQLVTELTLEQVSLNLHYIRESTENRRRIQEAAGKAKQVDLFRSMKQEFYEGLEGLRAATLHFRRAEASIDLSGSSFVRLFDDANLVLLFRTDSTCWYDPTGKAPGFEAESSETRVKGLITIHGPESGGRFYRTDKGEYDAIAAWEAYRSALLAALEPTSSFEFYKGLPAADTMEEAKNWLQALKLLLYRTHTGDLYDFSVIAHTFLAIDGHIAIDGRRDARPCFKVLNKDLRELGFRATLAGLLKWVPKDLLQEKASGGRPLRITGHSDSSFAVLCFISGWMQLIGSELVHLGKPNQVTCSEISIVSDESALSCDVMCGGILPPAARDLSGDTGIHGLRSCLKRISNAVGQPNGPLFLNTLEPNTIDEISHCTDSGFFTIGMDSSSQKTRFRLKIRRA